MKRKEAIKERRMKEQRRRRITLGLIVAGAVLVIAAFAIWPSLRPVGDVVIPDIRPRPMVDGRAMGDPDAPVVIEVFEDFQCPACAQYSEQIEPLIEETYVENGKVYYIYRHFPFLDDRAPGSESDHAAIASMCAAEQGAFWPYHDVLFANWDGENQGAFDDRRLIAFAEALELDMDQFEPCFTDQETREVVMQDFLLGRDLEVTGTPSVFINGGQVSPGFIPSFLDISSRVEEILESAEG
jgi:protein-disulfide isomerase